MKKKPRKTTVTYPKGTVALSSLRGKEFEEFYKQAITALTNKGIISQLATLTGLIDILHKEFRKRNL